MLLDSLDFASGLYVLVRFVIQNLKWAVLSTVPTMSQTTSSIGTQLTILSNS